MNLVNIVEISKKICSFCEGSSTPNGSDTQTTSSSDSDTSTTLSFKAGSSQRHSEVKTGNNTAASEGAKSRNKPVRFVYLFIIII